MAIADIPTTFIFVNEQKYKKDVLYLFKYEFSWIYLNGKSVSKNVYSNTS